DVLYPCVGFILGLGSPAGAFILRFWLAAPLLKSLWLRSELSYNLVFYLYMGIGTVTAFVIFGYSLGVLSEGQRVHNKNLRRRVDELRIKSVTDGLTGVFSHAYLQENLQLEIQRSRRHARALSVMILDLDDFKKVNDTHGHLFGDRVLKEVAETVNMNVRQEDVFGRYGGEEFMVIMPAADMATAQRVAERVRRAVARAAIVDRRVGFQASGEPVHMTVSIGLASLADSPEDDGLALIHRADRCLYRAKKLGKNRVCS
ncbi:MAG TPA: GGDEF domain-containing protein, partial [Elusimicrobiota bacterium]|nr:GGDEF domain-containing protein [Elusimicrobiota bacterium]